MTKLIFQTRFIVGLLLCSVFCSFGQTTQHDNFQYIDADGARLFVRSVGVGKPLVIVHGGPGMSHDYLAPQMIDLLSKDYQLIFYDQRASGRSAGVEDTTRLTMSQFVSDLEILRNQLKIDRLDLMGHSFGGLLTMYYATRFPNHVNKLLLLDTSPASWELNFPYFRKTIAERQTDIDKQEILAITAIEDYDNNPKLMDKYMKIFFRTFFTNPTLSQNIHLGIDEYWLANYHVTSNFIWNDLGNYDIHDQLKKITATTLLIHGDSSVISIKGSEEIAKFIPNARLEILKNVGHFPYIEVPNTFSKLVRDFFEK